MLRHPQREEVLPHVQMELPKLQFVPVAPCPVAGHKERALGTPRGLFSGKRLVFNENVVLWFS